MMLPRFPSRAALALAAAAALLAACGSTRSASFDDSDPNGTGKGPGTGNGDGFGGEGGAPPAPTPIGALKGTVYAPEGSVPISNALVYLTRTAPEAIPNKVFCDTCVQLGAGVSYTYSKPDGTFELPVFDAGSTNLVVQKGQFRRVRKIDVAAGDANVSKDKTTFPGASDPSNGDDIPRIAVTFGGYDKIELSLKKLGITQFDRFGKDPFLDPPGLPPSVGQPTDLINNAARLADYHIVLLPCSLGGINCGGPTNQQRDNLKGYVSAGGKVYVTDYSYEFVKQTWPGFITWKDKNGSDLAVNGPIGDACQDSPHTRKGIADDKGLGDWLTAIGESNYELKDSWTVISKVNPQQGTDPTGAPTTITPKVWMTSDGKGPSTVSFENQCGRVLFSTYHAEGGEAQALLAQEKALLYILLEVGVCVGQQPPPR
jgi:hypothetical protein